MSTFWVAPGLDSARSFSADAFIAGAGVSGFSADAVIFKPQVFTLPVRNIRIGFESPTIVKYSGMLGVQTDDPFTLWRHMEDVAADGGTAGEDNFVNPVSDGGSPASVGGTYVCMVPSPAANGTVTEFILTDAYQSGSTKVWMNGLLQRPNVEYVELSPAGKTISFYDPPLTGDQLWICYTST